MRLGPEAGGGPVLVDDAPIQRHVDLWQEVRSGQVDVLRARRNGAVLHRQVEVGDDGLLDCAPQREGSLRRSLLIGNEQRLGQDLPAWINADRPSRAHVDGQAIAGWESHRQRAGFLAQKDPLNVEGRSSSQPLRELFRRTSGEYALVDL